MRRAMQLEGSEVLIQIVSPLCTVVKKTQEDLIKIIEGYGPQAAPAAP